MADILRSGAHDLPVGNLAQLYRIVGHQTVPALDQLNGQLALADAAVAQDQDALAVHLHQHAVPGDAGSQLQVQHADQAAHQGAGRLVGAQQRHAVLFGQLQHLRERFQLFAAAHDNSRRLLAEQLFQRLVALFGREPGQKIHLCQTHDLQTEFIKIVIVSGQKQTRTVDLCDLNIDLVQFFGGIDHLQADALGQRFERDVERTHPCSSCVLVPGCAPASFFFLL